MTLVIGVGNPDRGDDGIGALVARRIGACALPGVAVLVRSGDVLGLIEDWAGQDAVVLVDAAMPNGRLPAPGRVHRIDLLKENLPADLSLASTHMLGVAEAVGLARALGMVPKTMIAYAIEGEKFAPGAGLSPEVAAAMDLVVARVGEDVRVLPGMPAEA